MPGITTPLPRAAVYIRVSKDLQEDNTSLGTQEERSRAYAAQHGYEVVTVYREVHTGAELWERPQMSAMRQAARAGEFEAVIAYDPDRLARSQVHTAILVDEFERAGIALLFVSGDFERTPEGRFLLSVKSFVAELEREKIRERTQRGIMAKVSSGKPIGCGRALYGYRWRDAKRDSYEIDPVTGPIVQRLFADVLAGRTQRVIAAQLTAEGIPTPAGSPVWRQGTVRCILAHPGYKGEARALRYKDIREGGKRVTRLRPEDEQIPLAEGIMPALVSEWVYDAVHERLVENKRQSGGGNGNPRDFLLRSGFIVCGYCGRAAACRHRKEDTRRKRGPVRASYITANCKPQQYGCGRSSSMVAAELDRLVWEKVLTLLSNPQRIRKAVERRQRGGDRADDLASVDRAVTEVERKRANLTKRLALFDDEGDAAPVVAEIAALGKQRQALERERVSLTTEQERFREAMERLDGVEEWCHLVAARAQELAYEQKREILSALGVKVRIFGREHFPRFEIDCEPLVDPEGLPEFSDDDGGLVMTRVTTTRRASTIALRIRLQFSSGD